MAEQYYMACLDVSGRRCIVVGGGTVGHEKAAGLGSEEAKVALKRLQCPYVLKDKRGNILTHLCF